MQTLTVHPRGDQVVRGASAPAVRKASLPAPACERARGPLRVDVRNAGPRVGAAKPRRLIYSEASTTIHPERKAHTELASKRPARGVRIVARPETWIERMGPWP